MPKRTFPLCLPEQLQYANHADAHGMAHLAGVHIRVLKHRLDQLIHRPVTDAGIWGVTPE